MNIQYRPEGLPEAHGLYDPRNEHDACGIGLIANIHNAKSHRMIADGLSILKNLDVMSDPVMLKLSLPVVPGTFDPLVDHPKVLRVVALSGGYKRPEACVELAKNTGIIASFSRALLEDLRHQMTDAEFDASLAAAIDEIYTGSTQKTLVAA